MFPRAVCIHERVFGVFWCTFSCSGLRVLLCVTLNQGVAIFLHKKRSNRDDHVVYAISHFRTRTRKVYVFAVSRPRKLPRYGDSPGTACRGALLGAGGGLNRSAGAQLDRCTSPTFALRRRCMDPVCARSQPDPSCEQAWEQQNATIVSEGPRNLLKVGLPGASCDRRTA